MRFSILAAVAFAACSTASVTPVFTPSTTPVPDAWKSVPEARRIGGVSWRDGHFLPAASVLISPPKVTPIRLVRSAAGDKLVNGEKDVTPLYPAIQSFDYDAERHEVIFAAKRTTNFDIGLAADDGSEIHWVPEDPADETDVVWAKGNKVTYFVHGPVGTLIRTVHIPTATPLTVDFPWASMHALAYEPDGKRFAVAYSTPDASDRMETLRYGGEERRMEVPPAVRLNVTVDRRGDAVLLTPASLQYNEKVPLAVWVASDPLAWNDAHAALLERVKSAAAIVSREPDEAFWTMIRGLAWIDQDRVFVIGDVRSPQPGIVIVPSAEVPAGQFSRSGNFVRVSPGIVESFAAGFAANQLKGTTSPDGNHHR